MKIFRHFFFSLQLCCEYFESIGEKPSYVGLAGGDAVKSNDRRVENSRPVSGA